MKSYRKWIESKSRRVVVIITAVALCFQASAGNAGWVDDWLQSKASTTPGYFEGQARGYATGGSFSARWPSRTDYPISVTPPRLAIGCGGIDAYMGSVSFLKPEMMVQKLQNILTNSAFLAFDMALDTLCPKCSTLMKAAEDISNKLNSMAMNDCNAAKGVVAGLRPLKEGLSAALWEDKGSEAISEGLTDSYNYYKNQIPSMPTAEDVNSWWNSQTGKPAGSLPSTSGCSGVLATLFPSNESAYPVSVMKVIGGSLSLPDDHVKLMRGLAGDIIINSDHSVDYMQACSRNASLDIDQFKSGDIDAMDEWGTCGQAISTQGNLEQYVANMMQNVSDKLKTGTALAPNEVGFVTNIPMPILYGMRVAIGSGQEASMISSLSGITASAWMERSLQDLLSRSDAILRVAAKANGNFVNGSNTCNLKVVGSVFAEKHKDMLAQVHRVMNVLNSQMSQQLTAFSSTLSISQHLEAVNSEIKTHVSKHFGPSVAARAMRYM